VGRRLNVDEAIEGSFEKNSQALDRLEQSADAREVSVEGMKYQKFFANLRGGPRFVALERRVGLNP
jgi:hypothetical protein